jgi:hypothetical protein
MGEARRRALTKLLLALGIVLLPCAGHAQSFSFSLHAFDDGADISGTTADGQHFDESLRVHPFTNDADMTLRYNDGRRQECRLTLAPFSGNISGSCRTQER